MSTAISRSIPSDRLRRLDFLLGESSGRETMCPPGQSPVQFTATYSAGREDCERFVKVEFFGDIPGWGIETFMSLITWSESLGCYRMWTFSSLQEDPMHLTGAFQGDDLVLVSDPWKMPWGTQRMRSIFKPLVQGGFRYLAELWEPDGYAKYCSVTFELPT